MSTAQKYADGFRRLLPSPFSIAIILTLVTAILTFCTSDKSATTLLVDWQNGLWSTSLLAFAFQMMLMLVLGHALALSKAFNTLTSTLIRPLKSTAQAAAIITLSTILVAFLNWGLALIFGAIMARKIGEKFSQQKIPLNYPLIGAAGYVGLMVWHGGISGSALAKAAESGHIQQLASNASLPLSISYGQTVFSTMNMVAFALLTFIIPLVFYMLGKNSKSTPIELSIDHKAPKNQYPYQGAEKIDHSPIFSSILGITLLAVAIYLAATYTGPQLGFITPNYINFAMLGLCILLHKNFHAFLGAIDNAIQGASGILIQFPLYFGILALMQSGGLFELISNTFIDISTPSTLPILTFISAGLVNIFVPSGGGQWAIQGPILLVAATQMDVPLPKMIMALAYGDQLTNMLQPFWALPLLSITGLKARDILPYTLVLFGLGLAIFLLILFIF